MTPQRKGCYSLLNNFHYCLDRGELTLQVLKLILWEPLLQLLVFSATSKGQVFKHLICVSGPRLPTAVLSTGLPGGAMLLPEDEVI